MNSHNASPPCGASTGSIPARLGYSRRGLLRSPFSLTEARVIYELAHREKTTATELADELGLDAGYLSRMLNRFQKRQLLVKPASETDGRQSLLQLTEQGQAAFAKLNADSQGEIEALLNKLSAPDQTRLLTSNAHYRGTAWRAAPNAETSLRPASTSTRRHGLGGPTSRRALCAGVWLE